MTSAEQAARSSEAGPHALVTGTRTDTGTRRAPRPGAVRAPRPSGGGGAAQPDRRGRAGRRGPRGPSGSGGSGGSGRPSRRQRPKRPWYLRPVALLLAVPIALTGLVGVVAFVYLFRSVPLPSEVIGQRATLVRYADGSELGTLQPEQEREDVRVAALPDHVVDAVLAAEDASFYDHPGVSIAGLGRAVMVNLANREVRQGGSTISQQYVKTAILNDTSRTALRKLNEAVLAVKLEQQYNKDEILEFYLNTIYWGRGAYGIQAAARAYYGVEAAELDPAQAAVLAGIIPAPSSTDPIENPERSAGRYRYVLDRLVDEGWMDPAEAGRLSASPPPQAITRAAVRFNEAPFFMRMVEQELQEVLGDQRSAYVGLDVTTTLDPRLQQIADRTYAEAFSAVDGPTGAMVVLSPVDGSISAVVGGEDYQRDQLNLALQPRQPGSTFKPFALAAWIEEGNSPESYFDAPSEILLEGVDNGRDWEPSNYEGAEFEPLSLRQATWSSVNTVYAQVAQDVGFDAISEVAARAGVDQDLQPFPSLVLGTQEVQPLELAEAYNTFASGGVQRDPYTVARVRSAAGLEFERDTDGVQAFEPGVVANVTNVLEGVVLSGTGRSANPGVPAAGKTGTTQDYADAWFAGYTPNLTAVVWMGDRDSNRAMEGRVTGGDLPAELWGDFMREAHEGVDVGTFPAAPGGLVVTRESPAPEPSPAAPSRPECETGQVVDRVDGELACVEVEVEVEAEAEPTPTPSPQVEVEAEDTEQADEPDPGPQAQAAPPPSPAPPAPPATSAPPRSPAPAPAPAPGPPPAEEPAPAPDPPPPGGAPPDDGEAGTRSAPQENGAEDG